VKVVIDAGWVDKIGDPLRKNRYVYELLEPMVRFQRIVAERNEARLQRSQAAASTTAPEPLPCHDVTLAPDRPSAQEPKVVW
jgi:hypothetical protein